MTELWRILVPLLVAHFLTDFVLQTKTMVTEKSSRNLGSIWLYIHAGIAGLSAYLLVAIWSYHYIFWVTAVTHLFIDAWKNSRQDPDRAGYFFADQVFHLLVIAGLCIWIIGWGSASAMIAELPMREISIIVLGLLLIMNPAGFVIQKLTWKWSHAMDSDDFPGAGHYIGILERIIVFVFVLLNQYVAIALLLAAKSIFRFGTLSQKREVAEFVLLETLLSFTFAILIGLLVSGLI